MCCWQGSHELTVNPLYLSRLGLGKEHLGPAGTATDGDKVKPAGQPVIASSVEKEKWEDTVAFMESVAKHMSGYHLVMFDLSSSENFNVLVSVCFVYCASYQNVALMSTHTHTHTHVCIYIYEIYIEPNYVVM